MEIVKELINLIMKYKVESIKVIGDERETETDKKTLIHDFYDCISKNKFETDNDAANYFFGTNSSNIKYTKLKKELKDRLVNTAFFIDTSLPSFNEVQRAYYNCCKDWASINILIGRSARHSAMELAEQVLKQAIKYEFTILIVDITKTLRGHYGGFIRNRTKYNKYKDLFNKHLEIWNIEEEAESLYTELITEHINSKSIHKIASQSLNKLEVYKKKFETHRLLLYYYLIEAIKYTSVNDYKNIVDTCERAIDFFEKKIYLSKSSMIIFFYQKVVCHIHLKEYEKGKEASIENLKLLTKGTYEWFKQHELILLLAFHSSMNEEAYKTFLLIQEEKNFKQIYKANPEIWRLYESYLYYLISIGQLVVQEKKGEELSKFRVGKFINASTEYSEDRQDIQIPILVIQILFMIQKKKYTAAITRIKEIEKYDSHNLRKDEYYRSNCFIKMLSEIRKNRFHKAAIIRKTEGLLKKLKKASSESTSIQFYIEIIPYEDLWDYLISSLDNKFH